MQRRPNAKVISTGHLSFTAGMTLGVAPKIEDLFSSSEQYCRGRLSATSLYQLLRDQGIGVRHPLTRAANHRRSLFGGRQNLAFGYEPG